MKDEIDVRHLLLSGAWGEIDDTNDFREEYLDCSQLHCSELPLCEITTRCLL